MHSRARFLCKIACLCPVHTCNGDTKSLTIGGSCATADRYGSSLSRSIPRPVPAAFPVPREGPVPLFLASVRTVKRARCSAPTVAGRSDGSMVHRLVERPSPDPPTRPYRSPPSVSFSVLTGFMPINTCRVRNAVSFRYILTPRLVTGAGAPTFQTADASRRCLDNRWTRAALADAEPLRRVPHRTRNLDREIQDRSDGFRR